MKTISAIYENGVFRPEERPDIPEGSRVEVRVPSEAGDLVEEMRRRYPGSFGAMSHEDAEEMREIIDREFGKVDPDEWR